MIYIHGSVKNFYTILFNGRPVGIFILLILTSTREGRKVALSWKAGRDTESVAEAFMVH